MGISKVKEENNKRLEVLFKQHHNWLVSCSFNISKSKDTADELVSELYVYLGERVNPSLWYLNSFNLQYCYAFLKTRFINRIKIQNRTTTLSDTYDDIDSEYNTEFDERLDEAYEGVVNELKEMEKTRQWASSKLAQLYYFNDDMTLERLASEIGICKSTAFTNIKKAKLLVRDRVKNPFRSNS
jgi:DNA-directed RNA polymerase specialized sigma24 family protein